MANISGFDATKQGEMLSFDAMPAHKPLAMMSESAMKPTKAGDGSSFLECKFVILDGTFKGRNVWTRLNLVNKNKQAEDIAQRELGAICKAVGIMKPNDSADLHNRPMIIDLDVEPGKDGGKPQNRIKGYSPAGAQPAGFVTTAAAANNVQPTPPAAAPWLRPAA